jgi:hypothetical protein
VRTKPGAHGVDAHALGSEFTRPGLGEADDPSLGGGVVGLPEVAVQADHRGRVDDRARTLRHHQVSATAWVHSNTPFRLTAITESNCAEVIFAKSCVLGDAGVVDQDVDAAPLGLRPRRPWHRSTARWVTSTTRADGLASGRAELRRRRPGPRVARRSADDDAARLPPANRMAVARPMPWAEPVTMATLVRTGAR